MGGVTVVTDRPPLGVRLKYRLLGARVPREWLPWVEQEIASPHYSLRTFARFIGFYLAAMLVLSGGVAIATGGRRWPFDLSIFAIYVVASLVTSLVFGERNRRIELAYQRGERGFLNFADLSLRDFLVWGGLGLGVAAVISFAVIRFT